MSVVRRWLTWLLALPLIVVGSQVAHALAYWWAYPVADIRLAVLERSGHGYLSYAPVALAFLAGLELLALAVTVVEATRGRKRRTLPAWMFLWLPAVAFVLQEYLERLFTTGSVPWWVVESPTFWRGLVLQVPLGVAAYAIARFLGRVAEAAACVIARRATRRSGRVVGALGCVWRAMVVLARPAPLAGGSAGRAPPLLLR